MTLEILQKKFSSGAFLAAGIIMIIIGVTGSLISLLFGIAIVVAYSGAKKADWKQNTGGLSFLRGMAVVAEIFAVIAIVVLLIFAILLITVGPALIETGYNAIDELVPTDKLGDGIENIIKEALKSSGFSSSLEQLKPLIGSGADIDIDLSELTDGSFDFSNILRYIFEGLFRIRYIICAIFAVILIITALWELVLLIFYHRNIRKLAKSVLESVKTGNVVIEKDKTVKAWFIVFIVFAALSLVGSLLNPIGLISSGLVLAKYILLFTVINKSEYAPVNGSNMYVPSEADKQFLGNPATQNVTAGAVGIAASATEQAEEAEKTVEDAAQAAVDAAKETVKDTAETVEDTVEEAAENITETVEETAENPAEAAEEAVSDAAQAAEEAIEPESKDNV